MLEAHRHTESLLDIFPHWGTTPRQVRNKTHSRARGVDNPCNSEPNARNLISLAQDSDQLLQALLQVISVEGSRHSPDIMDLAGGIDKARTHDGAADIKTNRKMQESIIHGS